MRKFSLPASDFAESQEVLSRERHEGKGAALKIERVAVRSRRSAVRIKRGERGIWQRRFWERAIRDDRDYTAHVDYRHINPYKHGYVEHLVEWPHSTFHLFVHQGLYPRIGPPERHQPSTQEGSDRSIAEKVTDLFSRLVMHIPANKVKAVEDHLFNRLSSQLFQRLLSVNTVSIIDTRPEVQPRE